MTTSFSRTRRFGFTLVELMVVIVIIAMLAALLLPAITGAVRNARNAAVSAEITQLGQALADFKSKYGDYPPSRIILSENGFYDTSSATATSTYMTTAAGQGADISYAQLAQRSITYLRKFFPRVNLSTTAAVWAPTSINWYDFNGNNVFDTGPVNNSYVISGDVCLVFFLGGIPVQTSSGSTFTYGMTGFDKNPANPFTNSIVNATPYPLSMYGPNRNPPLFEFRGERLVDTNSNTLGSTGGGATGLPYIPRYFDSLNTSKPYAYFSAYGNNAYDPNDVDYVEADPTGTVTTIARAFQVNFPVQSDAMNSAYTTAGIHICYSPAPNPYTSSLAAPSTVTGSLTTPVTWQNPQSFQIISAGGDGLYGVGGQFNSSTTTGTALALPVDGSNINSTSTVIRQSESDNITNFKNGTLQ
jgi:general secretion pathway protein G